MKDSAFPVVCGDNIRNRGLTKLEYASIHIACALIAAGTVGDVTARAKELADDLLK